MDYRIEYTPQAVRHLKKMGVEMSGSIAERLSGLASDPRPRGVEKIRGAKNKYRVRLPGNMRAVYKVDDNDRIVSITAVGDRKDIYRNL